MAAGRERENSAGLKRLESSCRGRVSFSGELATAVQYRLSVVIVVVTNGMFGTIRMHQERQFSGRVIGTKLVNPDFCALAQAYGAHAERVEETAAFLPALRRGLEISGPALIELIVDPEAITPSRTLSDLKAGG